MAPQPTTYFHSVELQRNKCQGCVSCVKLCPTEAIRVRNGKAEILGDRCIDCGACAAGCPYHAFNVKTDTLEGLADYAYNIVLPAPSLYAQFPDNIPLESIWQGLHNIGFDEIFDVKGPFNILNFEKTSDNSFALSFTFNDQEYNINTIGNGPIDACIKGLNDLHFEVKLINYSQSALDCPISGSSSQAMTVMYFQSPFDNQQIISRAINENTLKANVKAIFNGLNILYTLHNNKNHTSYNNLK